MLPSIDPSGPSLPDPWTRLAALYDRLRGPGGCAWDRAQTPETIAPYLLEEVHEVLEALESIDHAHLEEEAGDALFLWHFFLRACEETGKLRIDTSVHAIEQKLVRRHPHVFGSGPDPGGEPTSRHWERIKRAERGAESDPLTPLPTGLPALSRAHRLQEKAAGFGFDWQSARDVVPKIREETEELVDAMEGDATPDHRREELGDLLFAVVNLARHIGCDPEAALAAATEKFRRRFNAMARSMEEAGHRLGDAPLSVMEAHWQRIKRDEQGRLDPRP